MNREAAVCEQNQTHQSREALLSAPVPAGRGSRRPTRQSVCTHVAVQLAPVSLDPEQPFVSNQLPVHILVPLLRASNDMEEEKKAGQQMHCVAWIQNVLPWATAERKSSPHEGVCPNQPRLQENLLCGADWLCLRGISPTECAILPIRELAVYPQYSACEHPQLRDPVWELRHGRQPVLWANRQYLRLRTRPLEVGFGCGWRLLPPCPRTGT